MTIIAVFSASRQSGAPLHLAAQFARTTGERIIAAAVVERSLPAGADPLEDQYRSCLPPGRSDRSRRSSTRVCGDLDITTVIHHATSIPPGLMELAERAPRRTRHRRILGVGHPGQHRSGQGN
ncbi:hypothetical protein [Rhodococcus koreensis]